MRLSDLLVVPALLASAACASTRRPVTAAAPAPEGTVAPGLQLSVPGAGSLAGSALSAQAVFTTDRDAYAAAFLVTRDGRLRVLWPETPNGTGRVRRGEPVRTNAAVAQYAAMSLGARSETPYTFVIVSSERLDLSRFGRGKRWARQVELRGIQGPEDAIAAVAESVLPSPETPFTGDYAYVAPRLIGNALSLLIQCGRSNADVRDANYYADLWAVFDPYDNSLGLSSFATAWAYLPAAFFPFTGRGLALGLYYDRASRATYAFDGGCTGAVRPYSLAYQPSLPRPTLPTPAQPAAGQPTVQPVGDSVRIPRRPPTPDAVYGAPGTVASAPAAAAGSAETRMARLRDRMEAKGEGQAGERRAGGSEWHTEPLTVVDQGRLERALRRLELRESLMAAFERAGANPAVVDQPWDWRNADRGGRSASPGNGRIDQDIRTGERSVPAGMAQTGGATSTLPSAPVAAEPRQSLPIERQAGTREAKTEGSQTPPTP